MIELGQPSHATLLVEVRYFATQRDDWELLLLRAHQLGAGTIAARVPWAWHAVGEHTIDLEGATDQRRDLIGFVRLCGQLGLRVLLHPGPVHPNLLGGGAPAWLLQQHPDACALDRHGAPWRDAGGLPHPSALHPAFLAAARDWVAAFSAALRVLQAPDGPIAGLHVGAGAPERPDYNPAVATYPGAPELLPETDGAFASWYARTTSSITRDWLAAEGWAVALDGAPFDGLPADRASAAADRASATADPHSAAEAMLVLSLPGEQHPLLDAAQPPAGQLLRGDGSPRADFWQIKLRSLLLASAGSDAAAGSVPADLALADARDQRHPEPARQAGAALAQRLRQASLAFDTIDLDTTTPQELARYALVILPGKLAVAPATEQRLNQSANIALLDSQADAPASGMHDDPVGAPARYLSNAPRLSDDIDADSLAELIEQRGGIARYAWADGANIDLSVRYGASHTYLAIYNRRPAAYNGILAYRGRDGAVLHLHAGIGARCAGLVLLTDDEVEGAAFEGDAAEGGWLARGLRSSAMFNTGAGALARCGAGLLLAAPQSGRFQARRAEGWPSMRAYRLLLSGALLPVQAQIDVAHIAIAYIAEDDHGPTDLYLILPEGDLPPLVRGYLARLLAARAAALRRAVALAEDTREQHPPGAIAQAAAPLLAAADLLAALAFATLDEYSAAWIAADELCQSALAALAQGLTQARGALLAGQAEPAAHAKIERQIARISSIVALGNSV